MRYPTVRDALEAIRDDVQQMQVALNHAHAALQVIGDDVILTPEQARMIDDAMEKVAPLTYETPDAELAYLRNA